jgi:ribosomal protein S18 acetylase RimI-like enzyme
MRPGQIMPTDISSATRSDLPRLIEMFCNRDLKTSLSESEWFVNCYIDYHHVLVAKVRGKIQGACFWRVEGERYSGLGWIENLWVEEGHRRSGLGEILIKKAIEDIRSYFKEVGVKPRKVVLTTQVERKSARKLYEKMGFRVVARIDEMYDPGGHDLVYMLDFQQTP